MSKARITFTVILAVIILLVWQFHQHTAIIPKPSPKISPDAAVTTDPRLTNLKNFLTLHKCVDLSLAELYINKASEYGIDWRLLPAISFRESTCGLKYPPETNNLWGYGCVKGLPCFISKTGSNLMYFDSLDQGVDFIDSHLGTMPPYSKTSGDSDKILHIYNHRSTYPAEVESFMSQISP